MKPTGARAGAAISDMLAATLTKHKAATARMDDDTARRRVNDTSDWFESVLSPKLEPFLAEMRDHPDTPDEVRQLLTEVTNPSHGPELILVVLALLPIVMQLVHAAATPLLRGIENLAWKTHPNMPFPPADAALGVIRGHMDHARAVAEAENNGMKPELFEHMILNVGEPLALQELMYLWRRGHIDTARLDHGIRQSRIRNEWIDAAHALRVVPPSAGDAVMFALKGHMSEGDARRLYEIAGIDPAYFPTHLLSVGRPPGIQEILQLWNRGRITEHDVEAGIRQSDVNNVFIPWVKQLRVYIPPPRSIPTLLHNGAINAARAHEYFMDNGLSQQTADEYVASALHQKHAAHKEMALSQILDMYETRHVDERVARALLAEIDYDADEADFLLWIADHRRLKKFHEAAISTVHARYVGHHIDRSEASSTLDRLETPPGQRNDLIALWDLERDASTRELTPAEIIGAMTRGLRSPEWTLDRLQAVGYEAEDAQLKIDLAGTPAPPRPRRLPPAQPPGA